MKCPHCLESFHELNVKTVDIGEDPDGTWRLRYRTCPACQRLIVELHRIQTHRSVFETLPVRDTLLVWPKGISRQPLSPDVPEALAADYHEACLVLADSPKASAALSRRCLQHLLRDHAGTTKRDLADQIQEVLDWKQLPAYLANDLDAVRNIGNFAAHTQKSTATGEIVDVDPEEAEWDLDVLEALFEFYFVQPAIAAAKRQALNKKLAEAGKPAMRIP